MGHGFRTFWSSIRYAKTMIIIMHFVQYSTVGIKLLLEKIRFYSENLLLKIEAKTINMIVCKEGGPTHNYKMGEVGSEKKICM